MEKFGKPQTNFCTNPDLM